MRSKALPARALFRIVSGQASHATAGAQQATANGTSTTAPSAPRVARTSLDTDTRRKHLESGSRKLRSKRSVAPSTAFKALPIRDETRHVHLHASKASQGAHIANPPPTSLGDLATQAFYALDRPLLEYHVVSGQQGSSKRGIFQESAGSEIETFLQADEMGDQDLSVLQSLVESSQEAIAEAMSQASRMSPQELANTTFVIAAHDEAEPVSARQWTKRLSQIDHPRFSKLLDHLSKDTGARNVVQEAAMAIQKEESNRKDVEEAVSNALERGEDPRAAIKLGSEADLVVLGEPKGPNPDWHRGVATYLAQSTRAFEPPAAPSTDTQAALEQSKGSYAADEDPNLMLSHALVQAHLPPSLAWDSIVSKMNQATISDGTSSPHTQSPIIRIGDLDATLPSTSEPQIVQMDSVKRKRRKKMRKHKYRKLRKATRTERSRLKK